MNADGYIFDSRDVVLAMRAIYRCACECGSTDPDGWTYTVGAQRHRPPPRCPVAIAHKFMKDYGVKP